MRAQLPALLLIVATLAIVWSAVVWLNGGVAIALAGVRVSSTAAWRPFVIGLATGAAGLWLGGLQGTADSLRSLMGRVTPTGAAVTLAIITAVTGLLGNSWTASGPDPFAYVSQAALWRAGRLDLPVPLAADVPWPNAVATFAPFGYRAAPAGAPALVPITAPGVPLIMAALETVAGHWAPFVVTPLAGGALVLLSFGIGRRARSNFTGLVAAWLAATSPALLYNVMWPMADVPAAACAALMLWCLLGGSTAAAIGAGAAAALGTLVRPNFIVIAAGGLLWLTLDRVKGTDPGGNFLRRLIAFAGMLIPAVAIMLWLNVRWFGSPFASGYGSAGDLFSLARVGTNAGHFARWFGGTSPLALVGLAALLVPSTRLWPEPRSRRAVWLLRISVVTAGGVYLLYQTFADWWYLRFLLPAWPALFVGAGAALDVIGERGRVARAAVAVTAIAAGFFGVQVAIDRGVFSLGSGERRYVTIARLVENNTEANAVILTCQHSGTALYYAGRDTVRFDVLDSAWLDRAVEWLAGRGRHPYFLIEDWEQPIFETHFRNGNQLGTLSFPPVLVWQSSRNDGYVWLFDPLRRDVATRQPPASIERDQPICAKPTKFPKY